MLWDPPVAAGVFDSLSYRVVVVNMNTDLVIINGTTANTNYSIAYPQLCTDYEATVTTFSMSFEGDSAVSSKRTPGGIQL